MPTIRLVIDVYLSEGFFGDTPEERAEMIAMVFTGDNGLLWLHSNELCDTLGQVSVVEVYDDYPPD